MTPLILLGVVVVVLAVVLVLWRNRQPEPWRREHRPTPPEGSPGAGPPEHEAERSRPEAPRR